MKSIVYKDQSFIAEYFLALRSTSFHENVLQAMCVTIPVTILKERKKKNSKIRVKLIFKMSFHSTY